MGAVLLCVRIRWLKKTDIGGVGGCVLGWYLWVSYCWLDPHPHGRFRCYVVVWWRVCGVICRLGRVRYLLFGLELYSPARVEKSAI